MRLSLRQAICLVFSIIFAALADSELSTPSILSSGLEADEELVWYVQRSFAQGDANPDNLRCLTGPNRIPDNNPHSGHESYEFKLRAWTIPEWPQHVIITYIVKFLKIRKLGCQTEQAALTPFGTSTVLCEFTTPNGGPDGKVELDYGQPEPDEEYQVCSGGSLQGYVLLFALYVSKKGS